MIALRNELDRVQAENETLRQKLQTAENNALQQVETEAVLAVRKLLQTVETETDAYRKRIRESQNAVDSKPVIEKTKEQ